MKTTATVSTDLLVDASRAPALYRWRAGSADIVNAARRAFRWMVRQRQRVLTARTSRRLRVVESVSLGEKRFVSILNVDGEQFLIGGSTSNIALLAKLDGEQTTSFEKALARSVRNGEGHECCAEASR
jgi:Flagellar biosynthesis protein, FliO